MKIRIGRYVWNSKKCKLLRGVKKTLLGITLIAGIVGVYKLMWILYYALLPYSTMA